MRKLSLVGLTVVLGLFVATNVLAQGTMIGGKAGFNVADLSVDDDEGLDTRTGFVGGGFISFPIGDFFAIQPEVLYSAKGATLDFVEDGEQIDADIKIDYLEIPVLLVARLTDQNSAVRPIVYAGPAVSFEIKCKLEGTATEGSVSASVSFDCDDPLAFDGDPIETKGTDFGIVFGGGLEFNAGSAVIIVEGRYNAGLVDINDTSGDEDEVKNRAFSFMAGVGFPIGP